jgi:hypothetical protein
MLWRELGFGLGLGVFRGALKIGNCIDLVQTMIGEHILILISLITLPSCEVTTKL